MKKILIVLLIAFVFIQFFKPEKNIHPGTQANAIATVYQVPEDVSQIMDKACNDCHSNNTRYPWYNNIQPVAWWLNDHIEEGKDELNFDEFASYNLRRQYHKLDEVIEQVKKGEMPLNSYTWIHTDAKLSDAEKTALTGWAQGIMDQMKSKYPIDSLIRQQKNN